MNKPAILLVDDDPQVLAAVRRDVRSRYRDNYTVLGAGSGEEALATVRELKARGDSLALVLSDQRMPGMLGVEVLAQVARDLSAGQARVADGVFGHRCGGARDQRSASGSLPVQAVGSARRASLSGSRRSARRMAGRAPARGDGPATRRTSVVAAFARHQGFSREQSHSLSSGSTRARRRGPRASRRRRRAGAELPALFLENGDGAAQSDSSTWRAALASRRRRRASCTISSSSARDRPDSRRRYMASSEGLRTLLLDRHSPGRPGGDQLEDRELSRISRRASAAASSLVAP